MPVHLMSDRMKRRAEVRDDAPRSLGKKRHTSEPARNVDVLQQDCTVFGELICQAGASLPAIGRPVHLSQEPSIFQRSLQLSLKRHLDYPDVVEEFVGCLSKHIEDIDQLHSFLLPTVSTNLDTVSSVSGIQDSLLRLLLGISDLQPRIMSLLLEKLVEINVDNVSAAACGVNLTRLIMNQFRWLSHIVNSKELLDKMFEVMTVSSLEVQQELISCIPEVIDDIQHGEVAQQLKDLMVSNSRLTVPILDVLANLNLTSDLLSEVRTSAVGTLHSADIDDIPVIVRFLLQTVTPADALMVLSDIRENIDFSTIVPTHSKSKSRAAMSNRDACAGETLVLDALRSGMRFQKFVADASLKAIECVKSADDHRVIDIMLLLVLHSTGYKKQVESLCRSKITSGHLTENLLQSAFKAHAQVMREYFNPFLQLAEVLLRSPQPITSHFACIMYRHAFAAFDVYCRQEIVGNLVTHIGSGFTGEIEASLDILLDLVEHHTQLMVPFTVFVKGVLDYLDSLDISQIRKLYRMLCHLAFCPENEDSAIQDAMHIIVRKQLSNNIPRYQQMGVIGAVMIIMNIARKKGSVAQDILTEISQNSAAPLANETYQQVVSLLQLVKSSCHRSPAASAMFMEELAVVIRQGVIHSRVEEWISENVTNDFQDDFIVDVTPDQKEGEGDLPWQFQFALDDDSEGAIGVNMLPLISSSHQLASQHGVTGTSSERFVSIWCLSSQFRLLQVCEKQQHAGNLEGIDALLGCPIKLPKLNEIVDKLECLSAKERHILCDSLFLTINWFRETINAFSSQTDVEMKAKVIARLVNITELHQCLEKCLTGLVDYIPPPANFDVSDGKPVSVINAKRAILKGKRTKKNTKKSKKKEAEEESSSDESQDENRDETVVDKDMSPHSETTSSVAITSSINNAALSVYLRELDLDVFDIFRVGLITRSALDSNMNTKERETLMLQPPQLRFLLDDLVRKLEHSLLASAGKRRCFLKQKAEKVIGFRNLDQLGASEIARYSVDMLSVICQHTEAASAFFQALIVANDGLLDGPGSNTEECRVMAECLHLLFRVLLALFAWNGFQLAENRELLQRSISVLAGRLSAEGASSQVAFNAAIRKAYCYLEKFSASLPTLPAGVTLCRLLSCLSSKTDQPELRSKTGELAESLLCRHWYDSQGQLQKGSAHNELLQSLLELMFGHSEDVQGKLENLVTVAIPELLQADNDGSSTTYPMLTKHSYPVFYRAMLHELVESVKAIQPGKAVDPLQENVEKLVQWNSAVKIFHALVNLIKEFDASANLTALLKSGRQFVDIFIQRGMPMLDHMFRAHRDDIQSLLKNLQLSTRTLHHLCGHSKIIKNVSLTNQVPQLKKTLEGFVYRVKAMLTVNQCLEAFWLGNLKNRDIKGSEIVSQTSVVEQSDASSSDDSLPEDESSDSESDNISSVHNEDHQSYSEAF